MAEEIYKQPQIFDNNVTLNGPLTSNNTAVFNGVVTYNNDFIVNDDLDVQNSLFVGGSADLGTGFYDKVNVAGKLIGKAEFFGQPGEFYTDGLSALVLTQDFDFSKQNENRVVLFNDAETLQANKRSNILDFIQNVDGIEGILTRLSNRPYGNPVGQYNDFVIEVPILSGAGTPLNNLSASFILYHGGDNRLGSSNSSWTNILGNLSVTNDIIFDGNLTVKKNLSVLGDFTYLDTVVSVTSALSVVNTGTGPAAKIIQTGNQPIAEFWDDTTNALKIDNDYRVSFFNSNATNKFAVALGDSTTASGSGSFATGEKSIASGNWSTAFNFSTAAGNWSNSFGFRNTANGAGSIVIGQDNNASGSLSIAGGVNSKANGTGSIAIGNGTFSNGTYAVAVNTGTVAAGLYSFAANNEAAALGDGSFAINYVNVAGGQNSFVGGNISSTGQRVPFTYTAATATFTFAPAYSALTGTGTAGKRIKVYDDNVGFYYYTVEVASRNTTNGSISATADYIGIDSTGHIIFPNGSGAPYSFSFGEFNNVTGYGGIALGGQISEARGLFSYALGVNSIAEGENSYAIGTQAFASTNRSMVVRLANTSESVSATRAGQFILSAVGGSFIPGSVGIGVDNTNNALTVRGTLSTQGFNFFNGTVAQGLNTSAWGAYSFAEGEGSVALGAASHAGGTFCIANGNGSLAFGNTNVAGGVYSYAGGDQSHVAGNGSSSFGYSTIVANDYSNAFGFINTAGKRVAFTGYNNSTRTLTFANNLSSQFAYVTPGTVIGIYDAGFTSTVAGIVSARNSSSGSITFTTDIYGGNSATVSGSYAVAKTVGGQGTFVCGYDNVATNTGGFAGGGGCKSLADGAFVYGDTSEANNFLSFALGAFAKANHDYSYVWSGAPLGAASTRTNQYTISAPNGVFIPGNVGVGTDDNSNALTVNGTISARNNIFARGNITVGITTLSALSATTFVGTVTAATGTVTDKFLQVTVEGQTFGIPLYTLS